MSSAIHSMFDEFNKIGLTAYQRDPYKHGGNPSTVEQFLHRHLKT